jgi:biopolymer transport protein ExbB
MEFEFKDLVSVWSSGGWLMLPLLMLALYMYFTALDLYFRIRTHFLIHNKVYEFSDAELQRELRRGLDKVRALLLPDAVCVLSVRRHFEQVRQEYLPIIQRRIRFLSLLVALGPLVGLLGTVAGMLVTFNGMVGSYGTKFDNMITGISEALITTQTGLLISIPAWVILSIILHGRNQLERSIARLESYNVSLTAR